MSVSSNWNRENLAWVAGLFEGEGCIATAGGRWSINLASTDHDVLVRLYEIVGVGHINGPYDRGHKPHWVWQSGSQQLVYAFLIAIYPWLGERRQDRAMTAIKAIASRTPNKHSSALCRAGKHARIEQNVQISVVKGKTRRNCIPCQKERDSARSIRLKATS